MKQHTVKTVQEVYDWIESTPHHEAWKEPADDRPATHMNLRSHHERVRIPVEIWKQCKVRPGDEFDNRMYRKDES